MTDYHIFAKIILYDRLSTLWHLSPSKLGLLLFKLPQLQRSILHYRIIAIGKPVAEINVPAFFTDVEVQEQMPVSKDEAIYAGVYLNMFPAEL